MAREITDDAEYASVLAGGYNSMFWHSLPEQPKPGELSEKIQDTIYAAIRQVFEDRLNVKLPEKRRDPFSEGSADSTTGDT